jgi:hypothetical protein
VVQFGLESIAAQNCSSAVETFLASQTSTVEWDFNFLPVAATSGLLFIGLTIVSSDAARAWISNQLAARL